MDDWSGRDGRDTQSANDSLAGRGRRRGLLERARCPRGISAGSAGHGHCFRSRRFARLPADSRRHRQSRREPLANGAALRRGGGGHDRARHGGRGGHAGRQLRDLAATQAEMPGCDGSSLPFVNALQEAGIVEQDAPRAARQIRRVIRLGDEKSWIEARPCRGRPHDPAVRTRLRRRQPHRPAIAGNPPLAAVLPPQPGAQPDVPARAGGGGPAVARARPRARPSATCWSSTPRGRSRTPCVFPTSACATRSST